MNELASLFSAVWPVVDGLLTTYGGNVYRGILGTLGSVETLTASHPAVVNAANAVASAVTTAIPEAKPIVDALNMGELVLGKVGALAAADPTVQGPAAVPGPTAQPPGS